MGMMLAEGDDLKRDVSNQTISEGHKKIEQDDSEKLD